MKIRDLSVVVYCKLTHDDVTAWKRVYLYT